ncbi:GSU3473 family protein [Geobacter sp. AOG1]|uniref:GSU3473 family protein n=1 Tax=Geobacter sp. AOG1 TaxID=1566346 RepID=UPI0035A5D866
MAIKVIYQDGYCGDVTSSTLNYLIEKREVIAFKRSDGWAKIGRDAIRSRQQPINGPDKRTKWQILF